MNNLISSSNLPDGWIIKISNSFPDRVYYFNVNTGVSTWECPKSDVAGTNRIKLAQCLYIHEGSTPTSPPAVPPQFSFGCQPAPGPVDSFGHRSVYKISSPCDYSFDDITCGGHRLPAAILSESLPNTYVPVLYFVMDTNVFIHQLRYINYMKEANINNWGNPHFVIPFVVMQELDNLKKKDPTKKSHNLRRLASTADHYVNNMMKKNVFNFHFQTKTECLNSKTPLSKNYDDLILDCCLDLLKMVPGENVVLITNDINLQNKSLASKIKSNNIKSIYYSLRIKFKFEDEREDVMEE